MLEGIKEMINHVKENGLATIIILAAVAVIAIGAGVASQKWLGADNEVEEVAEKVLEEEGEQVLGLPAGSLKGKIDLSVGSAEKK